MGESARRARLSPSISCVTTPLTSATRRCCSRAPRRQSLAPIARRLRAGAAARATLSFSTTAFTAGISPPISRSSPLTPIMARAMAAACRRDRCAPRSMRNWRRRTCSSSSERASAGKRSRRACRQARRRRAIRRRRRRRQGVQRGARRRFCGNCAAGKILSLARRLRAEIATKFPSATIIVSPMTILRRCLPCAEKFGARLVTTKGCGAHRRADGDARNRSPARDARYGRIRRAGRGARARARSGLLSSETHQLGLRAGVGLLQIDVPIAQILEFDRGTCHRAAHEGAGTQNPEFAVEIFDFGFVGRLGLAFIAVRRVLKPYRRGKGSPPRRPNVGRAISWANFKQHCGNFSSPTLHPLKPMEKPAEPSARRASYAL